MAGVQLGPSMHRTLYLGLAAYSLVDSVNFGEEGTAGELKAWEFWYAGGFADYTILPGKLIHGSVNLLLGGGQVSPSGPFNSATVFVAEPGIALMVNLTPNVEFGLGAGYRFVSGSDIPGLANSDLSGLTGSVFFRLNETRP